MSVLHETVKRMIGHIGDNCERDGLKDTPSRVVKMWEELFKGYDKNNKPNITVFDNNSDGMKYDEMIIDTGIFFSHCEHHMIPFFGEYTFAYIPDNKIIGLSKIARLVEFHSARLQVQERLGKEIVDDLEEALKPQGIALILKGRHLCKEMRGVKMTTNAKMITSEMRGSFKINHATRDEFLAIIK